MTGQGYGGLAEEIWWVSWMRGKITNRESMRPGEGSGCQETNEWVFLAENVKLYNYSNALLQLSSSLSHVSCFVHLFLSIHPFFLPFYILTVLSNPHTKTPSTPSINTLVKSDWCWIFQYGSAYQAAPYDLPGWASERQRFAWRAVEWILYTVIYKWKACLQVHKHMNTRSTPTLICVDGSRIPQPIKFSLRLAFHLYFSILFE